MFEHPQWLLDWILHQLVYLCLRMGEYLNRIAIWGKWWWTMKFGVAIWAWINTYENTIFSGMNIHKSQLFWCELQGYRVLTHCHIFRQNHQSFLRFFILVDWKHSNMGFGLKIRGNGKHSLYDCMTFVDPFKVGIKCPVLV